MAQLVSRFTPDPNGAVLEMVRRIVVDFMREIAWNVVPLICSKGALRGVLAEGVTENGSKGAGHRQGKLPPP